jgi:hypothetical protein
MELQELQEQPLDELSADGRTHIAAGFITPEDRRWSGLLERVPHDVYHLPEYLRFAARHEGGRPAAFYAETATSAFLAPLLIRELPATLGAPAEWCDATTPYGYAAPISTHPADAQSIDAFLSAFRDVARAQNLVSAFFRLHPLLEMSEAGLAGHGCLERHGQTVPVDLSLPPEALREQTRANHRTGISKLLRAGFVATIDEWSRYAEFADLYRRTMERVAAAGFYFFSDEYFGDLRAALGERLHLCTVLSPAGDVGAAGLFYETDGIVQYHLGATADAYVDRAPSKLMFDTVRRWAKERGNRVLHLGGGLGGRADSLFHFKAGFSHARAEFKTLRLVLDDERYALLARRQRECTGGEPAAADPGFFPAYRQL